MYSLKDIQLKCNKQFIVNFDGGGSCFLTLTQHCLRLMGIRRAGNSITIIRPTATTYCCDMTN